MHVHLIRKVAAVHVLDREREIWAALVLYSEWVITAMGSMRILFKKQQEIIFKPQRLLVEYPDVGRLTLCLISGNAQRHRQGALKCHSYNDKKVSALLV